MVFGALDIKLDFDVLCILWHRKRSYSFLKLNRYRLSNMLVIHALYMIMSIYDVVVRVDRAIIIFWMTKNWWEKSQMTKLKLYWWFVLENQISVRSSVITILFHIVYVSNDWILNLIFQIVEQIIASFFFLFSHSIWLSPTMSRPL